MTQTEPLTHPPFDPELLAALEAIQAAGQLSRVQADTIVQLRAGMVEALGAEDLTRGGAFTAEDRTVPGPAGAPDITLLICHPVNQRAALPIIYHTHGGGMIAGDRRSMVPLFLEWAERFGAVVVSVEYRLAPEHPHPAPTEDCYAGLVWTAANAAEVGGDPDRILIVGASAGGGLAAAVSLMARDRRGPTPIGQMLMCPMLDDRDSTVSTRQVDGIGTWDRGDNTVGWSALLGDRKGGPQVDSYAAPARATDLSGLPPAFVDVGSVEVFRDEAVDYAQRIWATGGNAELHVWPGGYHGFDLIAPQAAVSQASAAARASWVGRILGG